MIVSSPVPARGKGTTNSKSPPGEKAKATPAPKARIVPKTPRRECIYLGMGKAY